MGLMQHILGWGGGGLREGCGGEEAEPVLQTPEHWEFTATRSKPLFALSEVKALFPNTILVPH